MDKEQANKILEGIAVRIKNLYELIDYDEHDPHAKTAYSNIKTEIENFVHPLRNQLRHQDAPAIVQAFVYPALNEALLELKLPKGRRASNEMAQCLLSAQEQILYYYSQLNN